MSADKVVFENVQPFKRESNCPAQKLDTLIFESSTYYCDCAGGQIEKLDFQFSSFKNWPKVDEDTAVKVQATLKYWIDYPVDNGGGPDHGYERVQLDGRDYTLEKAINPPVIADKRTMIRISLSVDCAAADDPNLDGAECKLALVLWYSTAGPSRVKIDRR
jgi:hypothetical protein